MCPKLRFFFGKRKFLKKNGTKSILFCVFLLLYFVFSKKNVTLQRFSENMIDFVELAGVAKLVDVSDLGSDAERHGGSSPSTRTFSNKVS